MNRILQPMLLLLVLSFASSYADTPPIEAMHGNALVTSSEHDFLKAWNTPGTSVKLPIARRIKRGETASVFIVFAGCKINASGICNLVATFKMIAPDNSVDESTEMPVWSKAPLPGGQFMLGDSEFKSRFERNDPVGTYKILAFVHDLNENAYYEFTTSFALEK